MTGRHLYSVTESGNLLEQWDRYIEPGYLRVIIVYLLRLYKPELYLQNVYQPILNKHYAITNFNLLITYIVYATIQVMKITMKCKLKVLDRIYMKMKFCFHSPLCIESEGSQTVSKD